MAANVSIPFHKFNKRIFSFSAGDIFFLRETFQSIERALGDPAASSRRNLEPRIKEAFSSLEHYEQEIRDYERRHGSVTANALTMALRQAGMAVPLDEELGDDTHQNRPLLTEKLQGGQVGGDRRIMIKDSSPIPVLDPVMLQEIESVRDPEEKGLLILEKQQILEDRARALSAEQATLEILSSEVDALGVEHRKIKKEKDQLDREVAQLTNKAADKAREGSLRSRRRDLASRVDTLEDQLKAARNAKSRIFELEKQQVTLRQQLDELARLEVSVFETLS